MHRILFVLFLSLMSLSACKSPPPPPDVVNVTINDEKLSLMHNWNLRGRLAFKSEQESFSAYVRWQQRGDAYTFTLTNLVGVTLLSLTVDEHEAVLEADGETYRHNDAEALIYEVSGWPIPVTAMKNWVKGTARSHDIVTRDDKGLLATVVVPLASGPWHVNYQQYTQESGIVLPRMMTISQSENLSIRLKVNQWEVL
ncbi:lipoprotein insertase outer membrane protein LolB [Alteromonas facilis]|uniref:lipoprotein insertase outer membrane protein LolB n=1 Tax=Alteromonas facilis TaxID=2048004 RepID=UPI000C285440|nr:lipoprotein insertase outer membrane protein LolB [Alteromonas facilis]